MLCPFCNTVRPANEAPCLRCGAPSPLPGGTNGAYGGMMPQPAPSIWGGPTLPSSNPPMNNWGQQQAPPFSSTQANNWGQQQAVAQALPQIQQQQPSMLPVPYQPQQALQPVPPVTGENAQLPAPMQSMADLVAALPEEAGAIYVAPMYTKPRPVIPRYRVISGFLSIFIVTLLLCAGVGYYAKTSGKLTTLGQFYGLVPPPNVRPAAPTPLVVPTTTQETGPAYGIINSATTTSSLNSQNVAKQQDIIFKPGQTIYLVYSVQNPKTPGIAIVKWYTNGLFYQSSPAKIITQASTVTTSQQYAQPAEGMVELYWNNQLAIRLYFVVR